MFAPSSVKALICLPIRPLAVVTFCPSKTASKVPVSLSVAPIDRIWLNCCIISLFSIGFSGSWFCISAIISLRKPSRSMLLMPVPSREEVWDVEIALTADRADMGLFLV